MRIALLPHRRWLAGGVAAAVGLLATGWFALISPQHAETANLREQAAGAQLSLITERHKLADLQHDSLNLPEIRANLAALRQALPADAELSAFLRELQAAGDRTRVVVRGMTVTTAAALTGASTGVYVLPITVTAAGSVAALRSFLDELQGVQPRAVLVGNVTLSPDAGGTSLTGTVSLTLSLRAFVAPTG